MSSFADILKQMGKVAQSIEIDGKETQQ